MSHLNMKLTPVQRLANRKTDKAYKNYQDSSPDFGTRTDGTRLIWFNTEKDCAAVWRFTGYAHDIIQLRHTGYYADNYQDEVIKGVVCQLPARNGQEQFLAGYAHDMLCFEADIYSDKEDAARAADSIAERIAEDNRKAVAKDAAEQQIAELQAEEKTLLADICQFRQEWINVSACGHSTAANVIRNRVRADIATIKANRKRIAKLEENYWEAVPN